MTSVLSASRETLEQFVSRLVTEHRGKSNGLCGSCQQWAPCPVERAAIDHGLVTPPPAYFEQWGKEWRIHVTDKAVVCETDWRTDGHGRIVTFDRHAVESGEPIGPGPWDPFTRSAWSQARPHILEGQREQ